MRLKYYLRGLGIGIVVTAIILTITNAGLEKPLTDEQIMERAEKLGMIRPEDAESEAGADEADGADSLPGEEEGPDASGEAGGNPSDARAPEVSGDQTEDQTKEPDADQKPSDSQASGDTKSSGDQKEEGTQASDSQKQGEVKASGNSEAGGAEASGDQKKGDAKASGDQKEGDAKASGNQKEGDAKASGDQKEDASAKADSSEDTKSASPGSEYVSIQIAQGDFSDEVCSSLKKAGLIEDAADFNQYLVSNQMDGRLRVGTHQVPKGATYEEIAEILCGKK